MKVVDLAVFSSTYEEDTHHLSFLSNVFPLCLVDVTDSLCELCAPLPAKKSYRTQCSLAGTLQVQVLVSS